MTSYAQLARQIQARYGEMLRPFPGAEIKRICGSRDQQIDLHTNLDLYLADIAGYSCGAQHLDRRSPSELGRALLFLSASFFEEHPQLDSIRPLITPHATPALYRELELAELNRSDLLALIRAILAANATSP